MFRSARLRLTLWYILILLTVSTVFSVVIYRMVSRQIEGLIRMQNDRVERFRNRNTIEFQVPIDTFLRLPPLISTEELLDQKYQLLTNLIMVNLGIVIVVGGASYFLSGRTLLPIKDMMDEQNRFISDSSHELRTPLATLRAEMEQQLLEKNISDKEARMLIRSNLEEISSIQQLSNKLLQLMHVHDDNIDRKYLPVTVKKIIDSARKKIKALAGKKHIRIITDVSDSVVFGNADELTEVFVILLDNAIKYSDVHTNITLAEVCTDSSIAVEVRDQGCGIADSDLSHIFDRFYRADKTRSESDGFGLGLSIAKRIIELHGGSITVNKNIPQGMVFIVTLPIHKA